MSTQTSSATEDQRSTQQKRLDTKARKQREAEESARILAEETTGARRAKEKAMANAIWKNPAVATSGRKRAASNVAQGTAEAKKTRTSHPPSSESGKGSSKPQTKPVAHGRAASRTPGFIAPEDIPIDEDGDNPTDGIKTRSKARTAGGKRSANGSQRESKKRSPQDLNDDEEDEEIEEIEDEDDGSKEHSDVEDDWTANVQEYEKPEWKSSRENKRGSSHEPSNADTVPTDGDDDGDDTSRAPPLSQKHLGKSKSVSASKKTQRRKADDDDGDDGDDGGDDGGDGGDGDDGDDVVHEHLGKSKNASAPKKPTKWLEVGDGDGSDDNDRAPPLSQKHLGKSKSISAPKRPTKWVEVGDGDGSNDNDRTPPLSQKRLGKSKSVSTSKKTMERRKAMHTAEQPKWPSTSRDSDSNDESAGPADTMVDVDGPAALESTNIELVHEQGRRYLRLKAQPPVIQRILHDGIEAAYRYGLWTDMFPSGDEVDTQMRTLLRDVARLCGENCVAERLRRDARYGNAMGQVLKVRLGNLRTGAREAARRVAESKYQLQSGCRDEVALLRTRDNFIWGRDDNGQPLKSKPYRHPAIIATLRWFFDESVICPRNLSFFKSSIPNGPANEELEIPIPMLALAATMVYAELYDWITGDRVKSKFNADDHCDTYQHHVGVLEGICSKSANERDLKFHRLMSDLFNEASNRVKKVSPKVDDNETLANLDFNNMDG
ncbi:hypothetical protein BD779DRAFT_1677965 [Infundibulicybe gibba]|nr:hypothetical protein BD779DRAFT_1677965 [Infundibulicybe gibba]